MSRLRTRMLISAWSGIGGTLILLSAGLAYSSSLFGYAYKVRDMPVLWLTGGLVAAGLLFLGVVPLTRWSSALPRPTRRRLLWFVIGAGLAMRLVLFASEPVLEDDYQRYLWDGAVTAHGINPYAFSPRIAKLAYSETRLGRLVEASGPVIDRVNHPTLRTLYPPVAQAAFALAHWISPFSLTAWRAVILVFDVIALGLLIAILRHLALSPVWSVLYWWNPIVLKELFNSGHMEAILVPLILGAVWLSLRGRPFAAGTLTVVAAGAKIWPLLLTPLLWRPLLARPWQAGAAALLASTLCLLFAAPLISAGLDDTSGLIAYAERWKTNSALFPVLEHVFGWVLPTDRGLAPGAFARGFVAVTLMIFSIALAAKQPSDEQGLVQRVYFLAAATFLLSPAQFPWYYLWVLPLIVCVSGRGLLILTATLPLYYSAFYFLPRGTYAIFAEVIVWVIWLPAWAAFAADSRWFRFPRIKREVGRGARPS